MEKEQPYTYTDKVVEHLNECRNILDKVRFSDNIELTEEQRNKCNIAFTKICEALDQIG